MLKLILKRDEKKFMEVVVTIPDKFVEKNRNLSRQMLEAFAIENYRQEKLSLGQVAELLGFSIDEANDLLKKHRVPSNYSFEDLEQDRRAIEKLLAL
jgi:predicted HTH domain antitoxin